MAEASPRAATEATAGGAPEVEEGALGKRARAAYVAQVPTHSTWMSRLEAGEGTAEAAVG